MIRDELNVMPRRNTLLRLAEATLPDREPEHHASRFTHHVSLTCSNPFGDRYSFSSLPVKYANASSTESVL